MDSLIEFLTYLYCGFLSLFVYALLRGTLHLIKNRNSKSRK